MADLTPKENQKQHREASADTSQGSEAALPADADDQQAGEGGKDNLTHIPEEVQGADSRAVLVGWIDVGNQSGAYRMINAAPGAAGKDQQQGEGETDCHEQRHEAGAVPDQPEP